MDRGQPVDTPWNAHLGTWNAHLGTWKGHSGAWTGGTQIPDKFHTKLICFNLIPYLAHSATKHAMLFIPISYSYRTPLNLFGVLMDTIYSNWDHQLWGWAVMVSYLEKAKQRQQKAAARLADEPQATQLEDSQQTLPAGEPGPQDCMDGNIQ